MSIGMFTAGLSVIVSNNAKRRRIARHCSVGRTDWGAEEEQNRADVRIDEHDADRSIKNGRQMSSNDHRERTKD